MQGREERGTGGVKAEKRCTKCKELKSVSEFYRYKTKKGQIYSFCKKCICIKTEKWHQDNPEKAKRILSRSDAKRRKTPKGKLSGNICRAINHSLQHGSKSRRHWETLVGYSVNQLKTHLEKQFKEEMNWENYGQWHIDHKTPIVAFNFEKPEDIDFKKCWALKNLQPLWATENISKNGRLDKPYQPSLLL